MTTRSWMARGWGLRRWRGSRAAGISPVIASVAKQSMHQRAWKHGLLRFARNDVERAPYLIFSYAAPKSASGIGMEMVSFAIFWNDTFNCLPDFNAASTSGEIGRLA